MAVINVGLRCRTSPYLENGGVDVGQGNSLIVLLVHSQVFQHGLDGDGELGDLDVHLEDLSVGTLQLDVRHLDMIRLSTFWLSAFFLTISSKNPSPDSIRSQIERR